MSDCLAVMPSKLSVMKSIIKFSSVFFMIVFLIISCKKDNNENNAKTKPELLTSVSWKRTALISTPAYDWNADGISSTDVLSIMWPCGKDNLDIYKANGILETDEGQSKCNPSDPQSWTATWALLIMKPG